MCEDHEGIALPQQAQKRREESESARESSACPNNGLPAELRCKIYDFVLRADDQPRVLISDVVDSNGRTREHASSAQLLRTCKAIYAEAAQALYASHIFVGAKSADIMVLSEFLSPLALNRIKHFVIARGRLPEGMVNRDLNTFGGTGNIFAKVWPKFQSFTNVALEYNHEFQMTHLGLDPVHKITTFVRRLARSKLCVGHFLHDYADFAKRDGADLVIRIHFKLGVYIWALGPGVRVRAH